MIYPQPRSEYTPRTEHNTSQENISRIYLQVIVYACPRIHHYVSITILEYTASPVSSCNTECTLAQRIPQPEYTHKPEYTPSSEYTPSPEYIPIRVYSQSRKYPQVRVYTQPRIYTKNTPQVNVYPQPRIYP